MQSIYDENDWESIQEYFLLFHFEGHIFQVREKFQPGISFSESDTPHGLLMDAPLYIPIGTRVIQTAWRQKTVIDYVSRLDYFN